GGWQLACRTGDPPRSRPGRTAPKPLALRRHRNWGDPYLPARAARGRLITQKFVQFGAGNIGRGFTGQLFSDAGYALVFVDVRPEVVAALNERGRYRLRVAGPTRHEERELGPARAVDGRAVEAVGRERSDADLAS